MFEYYKVYIITNIIIKDTKGIWWMFRYERVGIMGALEARTFSTSVSQAIKKTKTQELGTQKDEDREVLLLH